MAWVYIARMINNQYYVGSTTDLNQLTNQHRHGDTATTKNREFSAVVLKQEYNTLKQARTVERKIKKLKRRDYIEEMIKGGYIKMLP